MSQSNTNSHDSHGGEQAAQHGHKKKHHQHGHGDHPEHEEGWIVSFADNVLLMMGFFVILLAMNMGPKAEVAAGKGNSDGGSSDRLIDFAIAVREGFNSPVNMDSTDPNDAPLIRRIRALATEGGETKQPGVNGNDRSVQATRTSNWVDPTATVYFTDLETDLSDDARHTLAQAVETLKGKTWMIDVRGHVSAIEANGNPSRAMEMAYKRAQAAAEELIRLGVAREQVRVTGCADNERVTGRASDGKGHQSNQRVEVIKTQETMPGDPYNQPAAGSK